MSRSDRSRELGELGQLAFLTLVPWPSNVKGNGSTERLTYRWRCRRFGIRARAIINDGILSDDTSATMKRIGGEEMQGVQIGSCRHECAPIGVLFSVKTVFQRWSGKHRPFAMMFRF
ncbi:uncharacterized protein G2W53_039576 [Senna tora]|uniref:Uncharacterized protein n=1 Tax=Senna tora TaxID=362788 RepID=A0A834SMT5_9FABA|nr:uncharacterized protein G2W53_039576 [Senna tora]